MRRERETSANELLELAKSLVVAEKAALVEGLMAELDRPDESVDAERVFESERKLLAYREGEIRATPLAGVDDVARLRGLIRAASRKHPWPV